MSQYYVNVNASGMSDVQTLTGNSGGAVPPTGGNINTLGTGSITIAGNAGTSTLTTQLTGLTNHNVLVGAGTATITNVPPSTAGFVLTSNGAAADPSFQSFSLTTIHVTSVTTTPYVVLATDYYLSVTTASLPITIELPNAPATGRIFVVKDSSGNAATNNITVTTVGGAVNIDGATTYVMNQNYGAMNLCFTGTYYEVY